MSMPWPPMTTSGAGCKTWRSCRSPSHEHALEVRLEATWPTSSAGWPSTWPSATARQLGIARADIEVSAGAFSASAG
jgi:hypothetical protein